MSIPTPTNIINVGCESVSYPSSRYFRGNMETYKLYPPVLSSLFGNISLNLIVTGSSGLLFGSYLMMQMNNTELIHIRKDNESSHGEDVEGNGNFCDKNCKNIIVDDFVASGRTLQFIKNKLETTNFFVNQKINGLCVTGNHSYDSDLMKIQLVFPNLEHIICG